VEHRRCLGKTHGVRPGGDEPLRFVGHGAESPTVLNCRTDRDAREDERLLHSGVGKNQVPEAARPVTGPVGAG
jgi:hypothetical protein